MIKKLNANIRVLLLGTLFTRTAWFMSIPFLAIYLSNERHFSPLQIGYILGISPLINVLCSPLGGYLTDKINKRIILTYTPILWGFVFICFFFAESFITFLLLNGANGLCYVIFEPSSKRAISFFSPPEQRIISYNFRYAALNIGALVGPLLSLLFAAKDSLYPYLLLGCFYIIYGFANGLVLNFSSIETVVSIKTSPKTQRIAHKKVLPFVLVLAGVSFSYFGYSQFNSIVPQFFSNSQLFESGVTLYHFLLTMNAGTILLLQFPVVRFTKGISSYVLLTVSNGLFGVSLFLLPFAADYPFIIFLVVLSYSLGELLLGARFDYLIDSLAPNSSKGLYFGLAELTKLGSSLGPVLGSYLFSFFSINGYFQLFLTLGLITLGGIPFIQLSSRYSK
ncbi:MFS transporter [Candidatus Enterococcus mansonii]|uniref:Major facilitator superfamily (MFS) profile domain-containing protein n=1 Tax=Candidatus Enterococcus mansonii TaxID=1834181 RepID=A0A242CCF1_9ENTE|nr:MFS transporter [Enterococcus sp. 4G2_DIV0659]OTO07798.1 hypothetical protein A5880_002068 [Enterococcus sp. 4G2_DIV0659]